MPAANLRALVGHLQSYDPTLTRRFVQVRNVASAPVGQMWGRTRGHGPPSSTVRLCPRLVRSSHLGEYSGARRRRSSPGPTSPPTRDQTREGMNPTRFPAGHSAVQGCPYMLAAGRFANFATSGEHRRTRRTETRHSGNAVRIATDIAERIRPERTRAVHVHAAKPPMPTSIAGFATTAYCGRCQAILMSAARISPRVPVGSLVHSLAARA